MKEVKAAVPACTAAFTSFIFHFPVFAVEIFCDLVSNGCTNGQRKYTEKPPEMLFEKLRLTSG